METDNDEKELEDSIKISVNRAAEKHLSETVKKVNDGYEGGKVTRQILASWLLDKGCRDLNDTDIKSIRSENFNAANALSALVRKVQETGYVSPELRKILFLQAGLDPASKKQNKNKLTTESTNGVLSEDAKSS